jgi:hypothetical protein
MTDPALKETANQIQDQMDKNPLISQALAHLGWIPPGKSVVIADVKWAIDQLTYGRTKEAKDMLIRSIKSTK